jgi:cytidine deaminase
MQGHKLTFRELEPQDIELINVAKKILQRMYRLGRHTVGAAILCSSNRTYTDINVEKCVYHACAESRAMTAAFGQGDRVVLTLVTVGKLGDEYVVLRPCDDCQEFLLRHAPEATAIVRHGDTIVKTKVRHLAAYSRMIALDEQRSED